MTAVTSSENRSTPNWSPTALNGPSSPTRPHSAAADSAAAAPTADVQAQSTQSGSLRASVRTMMATTAPAARASTGASPAQSTAGAATGPI